MLAVSIPQRTICNEIHIGRGVLAKYKNAADKEHLAYSDAGKMSEEDLHDFLKSTQVKPAPSEHRKSLEELIPEMVLDLSHNRYLTVQKLHEDYKKENPDGYSYTQFKKLIREYQYSHNLSFHNTFIPGEEMQIDFAGDPLWLTVKRTEERIEVAVLVCVLPFSGLGFVKAMYNASMEHFFCGISDAFTFFGGTTRRAKSDNMKQWVKKHDRYEPVFNDAAVEWAAYYETSLETCRVRSPRDKASVEGLVQKVYNAVYAEIREEVFYDLNDLNNRIYELMDIFNSKPSRNTGRSRLDIFESEEKSALGYLPDTPYRFRYRKTVKLTGSYHVQVDDRKFSVPYQYVGQMVNVIWDVDTVEIYIDSRRVAIHERYGRDKYSTLDEHMPDNHLAYMHGQGYNAAYFLEMSDLVGPYTKRAVEIILKRNKHVEQGYSSCQGVMSLKRSYGNQRLENACRRLSSCSSISYTMIKNILQKNLDTLQEQQPVTEVPVNDYVRGAEAFNI